MGSQVTQQEVTRCSILINPIVAIPLDYLPRGNCHFTQGKSMFVRNLITDGETAHGNYHRNGKKNKRISHGSPGAKSYGLAMVYLTTRTVLQSDSPKSKHKNRRSDKADFCGFVAKTRAKFGTYPQ